MNLKTYIIIVAAAALMTACTDEADAPGTTAAPVNIIVDDSALTRGAVKTGFEAGDEIIVGGFTRDAVAAEVVYTLGPDGAWTTTDKFDDPAIDTGFGVSAAYGNPNDRPRTDVLLADASTADGNITLGIGAGNKPVWNIRLEFKHTRPAADVVVKNAAGEAIPDTDIRAVKITMDTNGIVANPTETITAAAPATGIILEYGYTITRVAVTIAGIEYAAAIAGGTALAAGKRYTINFTASPMASVVNISTGDDPEWDIQAPTPAGYDYVIRTRANLAAWATAMADAANLGKKAIQMADIIWDDDWMPVGDNSNPFTGWYNGNGYTISGMRIGTTGFYAGMFGGVSGALLANIHLREASITGQSVFSVGLLAGNTAGGTISLCSAQGAIVCHSANAEIGGLTGSSLGTHITRSYANAVITGTPASIAVIGGLAGYNYTGSIVACGANANINLTANTCAAGGLAGNNTGSIYFSYATGNVTADGTAGDRYAGGLVGANNATIAYSYATANATGTGGFTGSFAGMNYGAITSCHATGTANGAAGKPVAGGTHGNVNTIAANRSVTVDPVAPVDIPGIRTVVTAADGSISISEPARTFISTAVWTADIQPGINYSYEGI